MGSAKIGEPPGAAKLALIRRFLVANGNQAVIDSGSFLERFAVPGSALSVVAVTALGGATFQQSVELTRNALLNAYEKHRAIWQEEYENHVNWEFDDDELFSIVSFLESPVGEHFLEGRWRMGAYISTSTEHLIEQILAEAETALAANSGPTAD